MLNAISHTPVYVLDQDEALEFYVGTLGLEVASDADMGFMRWLTVRVPGDSGREILLERPGPPGMDDAAAEQVRELVAKGAGPWLIFRTDDCRAAYEQLKARGVEFVEPPEDRPYGIDAGFRDPSGNHLRLTQVKEIAAV
jgi:predicted enzyme related to lactoylglutathione lyase